MMSIFKKRTDDQRRADGWADALSFTEQYAESSQPTGRDANEMQDAIKQGQEKFKAAQRNLDGAK